MRKPRRNIDLDKVSQVLRGSANDNLIAETGCFVFNSLFYREPVQLLKKRLACPALRDLKMSFTAEFCTCWSGLLSVYW